MKPRIDTLEKIATGMGAELWELFIDPAETISGTLEHKGELYRIRSKKDMEELLKKME